MTSKDETTTTEQEQDTTAEETVTEETTTETAPKADPLDALDDGQLRAFALAKDWKIDESLEGSDLLAKVKERRSISQRHGQQTQPKTDDAKDVVRTSDLEKVREQEAKESLEESDDPVMSDIRDNWSEIAAYYTPRNGRATAKSILKDMRIARAAYREANPLKEDTGADAERDLSTVSGKGGTSPKPSTAQKKHVLVRSKSIDSWYPKAEN